VKVVRLFQDANLFYLQIVTGSGLEENVFVSNVKIVVGIIS
jgi:hypothetical protein